jgi:hypothetical protein
MAFQELFDSLNLLPQTYNQALQEGEKSVTDSMKAVDAVNRAQALIDKATPEEDTVMNMGGSPFIDLSWKKKQAFNDLLIAAVGNEYLQPAVSFYANQLAEEQRSKMDMARQLSLLAREEKRLSAADEKQTKKQKLDEFRHWADKVRTAVDENRLPLYTQQAQDAILAELDSQRESGEWPSIGKAMKQAGMSTIEVEETIQDLVMLPDAPEVKKKVKGKVKTTYGEIDESKATPVDMGVKSGSVAVTTTETPIYRAPRPSDYGEKLIEQKTGNQFKRTYTYNPKTNEWEGPVDVPLGVISKTIASPNTRGASSSGGLPTDSGSYRGFFGTTPTLPGMVNPKQTPTL